MRAAGKRIGAPQKYLAWRVAVLKARKQPMRPLDQMWANDAEESAWVTENAERLKAKLSAQRARNTFEAPRRDPLADRDIFHEIQLALRAEHEVSLTARTPPLVTIHGNNLRPRWLRIADEERTRRRRGDPPGVIKRTIPLHKPEWDVIATINRGRGRRGELGQTFWVPRWEDTGPMLKALAWAMVLYEGDGQTLNLNLTPAVIAAAQDDRRLTFAQHMRERLRRELKRALDPLHLPIPEFFFAVESTKLGDTHLHGAILAPRDDVAQKAFREALFRAVTERGAKRTGREVKLQDLSTPATWANYTAKWWRGSAFDPDGRVFAATSGLRGNGRRWYIEARKSETPLPGHEPDAGMMFP